MTGETSVNRPNADERQDVHGHNVGLEPPEQNEELLGVAWDDVHRSKVVILQWDDCAFPDAIGKTLVVGIHPWVEKGFRAEPPRNHHATQGGLLLPHNARADGTLHLLKQKEKNERYCPNTRDCLKESWCPKPITTITAAHSLSSQQLGRKSAVRND